jgi:phenylacetic acid degradation operon negative regulatory protein
VSNTTQQRLDAFRQQRRVQAGSLIITAFGDAILPRGGRIWLGSLIRLLEPLELNERLIRTSVFRLAKEEWLRTETIGRRADYVLTLRPPPFRGSLAPYLRRPGPALGSPLAADPGGWRTGAQAPRATARRPVLAGLRRTGRRLLRAPERRTAQRARRPDRRGPGPALGALLPLFAADSRSAMSASDADLVSRAWDLGALADAYSEFVTLYQPILDELRRDHMAGLSDQDAFLLRLLLIHDYRRLLLRDPELPEVLQPADWPGQQARLLCKELYKRLEAPSNRHLDQEMCLADGSVPVVDRSLPERFPQYDPLKKT